MKIGVIAPAYAPVPGGVETVVTHLASAFVRAGHEVQVWTQHHGRGDVVDDIDGVVVRRFPAAGPPRYPVSPSLWRYVRENAAGVDVLHAHSYHSSASLGLLAARASTPLVFSPHYHGGGHTLVARAMHGPYRLFGRRILARASAIVTGSHAEARLLRRDFTDLDVTPVVIPHAVDHQPLLAATPLDEPATILSFGRLEPYKRVDRLIDAFANVPPPTQLVIVGAGPDRDRLQQLAALSPARARIHFRGSVTEELRSRWLRTAGVVVSLSERESFGLIGAEAAAAGANVVLSDIDAHREVQDLVGSDRATLVGADVDSVQLGRLLHTRVARRSTGPSFVRLWSDVAEVYLRLYSDIRAGDVRAGRRELEPQREMTASS